MPRIALALTVASLAFVGAGLVSCVGTNSAPPAEPPDGGLPSPEDATIPVTTSDATVPVDAHGDAPADTNAPPIDAGTDAPSACAAWTPVLDFDASAWDGAALSIASAYGTPLPGPPPATCQFSGAHAPLYFYNSAPCPIDVWWVDWDCEEDFYATVPPGDSWYSDSWATDVFRLRVTGSEELLQEFVVASLDDAGHAPTTTILYPPSTGAIDAAAFPSAPWQWPDASACTSWDAAVEYDAGEWDGAASQLEDDAGTVPGPPATVCSVSGDKPYSLLFVNNSGCPVDVYWVDYNCQEVYWVTVLTGETGSAASFATNVWRIRATGSGELLAEVPIVPESADAGDVIFRYP